MKQLYTNVGLAPALHTGVRATGKRMILVLVALLLATLSGQAQDVILRNDKTEIETKVLEITEDVIKYKRFDFLDGPLYNIKKTDVFMIIYSNGKREKFINGETTTPKEKVIMIEQPVSNPPASQSVPVQMVSAPADASGGSLAAPAAPKPAEQTTSVGTPASTPAATGEPAIATAKEKEPAPAQPLAASQDKVAVAEPAAKEPVPAGAAPAAKPVVAEQLTLEKAAAKPVSAPVDPISKPAAPAPKADPAPVPAVPDKVGAAPASPAPTVGQLWAKPATGPCQQRGLTIDGNILMLRAGVLQCVSRVTGEELWQAKADQASGIRLINGTTFVQVVSRTLPSQIINSTTGKVVYHPGTVGHLTNRVVKSGNILVWGTSDKATEVLVLDAVTGEKLVSLPVSDSRAQPLKVVDRPADGRVLFYSGFGVTAVDSRGGKLLFNTPLKSLAPAAGGPSATFAVFPTGTPDMVGVLKDGYLSNVNLLTGQVNAEAPMATTQLIYHELGPEEVIIGQQTKSVLALRLFNKVNCQELKTGEVSIIGTAGDMEHLGPDLFVICTSTVGGSTIKQIDLGNLKLKAEKTFSTGGQNYGQIFTSGKGMGVQSAVCIDFFDPKTYASSGRTKYFAPTSKSNLKLNDDIYFFDNGYLGRVNPTKGEEVLLYKDKLPLKLQEEEVPQLEVTDDGVVVLSSLGVAKVDFKGKLVYSEELAPAGGSAWNHALPLAAASFGADDAEGRTKATSTATDRMVWAATAESYEGLSGDAGKHVRDRFARTASALNYQLMLTKAEGGDAAGFKLVKFNKRSGKGESSVQIDDKSADYMFDPVDNIVYVFTADKLKAYKL
ncbi:PQQ-binding-like beta-propeller repeat protein [Hymenobacter sp. BT175]|uniref:outer membrane protein assembly factor BamB family protein n=1 Tax=Hymenobacter translucens TaxID=2886507 RepID=UPI001D0E18B9|nr:PQQ-binding-like beta-propeller repeat protein [Hymenobacter translucens]MCC2545397.1 PQQ-binding-like beta-propeller repeat protein [Hymenobacter translucens]